ncbi:hypothetical protein FRB99_002957 [Tulasnella sp. 403]|nr:hypothetical protein FRB99_002957 [Tulasnella sp. 403]
MNPTNAFPFTDDELNEAGLLGEGESLSVSESVREAIKTMRERPELLSESLVLFPQLSLFALQCMNDSGHRKSLASSPVFSDASSYPSALSLATDATANSPYAISDWERTTYYHGISPGGDHPELLYRSDLLENPFPTPKGRHPHLPTKTACGVFNTPLNAVWDTVAPQIRELLKTLKIRYSAFNTARFVTHGEDGKDTLGPIVIWIATHPGTTTAENAHGASLEILSLLKANGVEGVVVEWYEGVVERLAG